VSDEHIVEDPADTRINDQELKIPDAMKDS